MLGTQENEDCSFAKENDIYSLIHSSDIDNLQGANHLYDNVYYGVLPPPPTLILSSVNTENLPNINSSCLKEYLGIFKYQITPPHRE